MCWFKVSNPYLLAHAGPPAASSAPCACAGGVPTPSNPACSYRQFRSRVHLLIALQAAIVDAVIAVTCFREDLRLFTEGEGPSMAYHGIFLAIIILQLGLVWGRWRFRDMGMGGGSINVFGVVSWGARISLHLAFAAGLVPRFHALDTMARFHLEPFVEWMQNLPCKQVNTVIQAGVEG